MKNRKLATVIAIAVVGALALTGCTGSKYEERKQLQESSALVDSQEIKNLKEKRERDNDPEAIRYVYVMSFATIIGYYVSKGKISSNSSQIGPELEIVQPVVGGERYVVDSAKDDASFGTGDPGIFFFTSEGALIETDLNYMLSDAPLNIDVPRLLGNE